MKGPNTCQHHGEKRKYIDTVRYIDSIKVEIEMKYIRYIETQAIMDAFRNKQ